jgi:hypothetical protein
MSRSRTQKGLVAVSLIALIAVAATELYPVRETLALFLIFCAFLCALGLLVLVSIFLGDAVVRCFDLLVTCAAWFRLRRPFLSPVGPLRRGIGKS